MPNVVQSDQFQIVTDLLKRQDDALEKLDELNLNVEKAIQEIGSMRQSAAESELHSDEDQPTSDSVLPAEESLQAA